MSRQRGDIPILRIGTTLLATVHIELRDAVAEAFQADVLAAIETTGARGLVIDISGLDMVDSYVARILAETGQMARLMGTRTILVGMQPEVAATLIAMGFRMDGIESALDIDSALLLLGYKLPTENRLPSI